MLFWINGIVVLSHMRFLFETETETTLDNINFMLDGSVIDSYKLILETIDEPGLYILKVKINTNLRHKYNYQVEYRKNDDHMTIKGSFTFVPDDDNNDIKFGFVSCNSNGDITNWASGWSNLFKQSPEVLIHMGDQIYADSVWGKSPNELKQLYQKTWKEPTQAQVMRNTQNMMILDDHEVNNDFGTVMKENISLEVQKNNKQHLEFYKKYQESLVNRHHTDNYYYHINIGKFCIIFLDQRVDLYNSGKLFSNEQLSWITDTLMECRYNNKEPLIISPRVLDSVRPLDNFKYMFKKKFFKQKILNENLLYSDCVPYTIQLLNILKTHVYITNNPVKFITGDVHYTYMTDIYDSRTNRKIIRQFVTSAITQDTAIDDVNIFKKLIKFIEMLMVPRLCGYKFSKKYNLFITNNFGTLQNNIFKNYIKSDNVNRKKILYIVNTFRLSLIILFVLLVKYF